MDEGLFRSEASLDAVVNREIAKAILDYFKRIGLITYDDESCYVINVHGRFRLSRVQAAFLEDEVALPTQATIVEKYTVLVRELETRLRNYHPGQAVVSGSIN